MTGLRRAEQIARTANFQIPHGNLEARAEFRVVPNRVQTLFRDLRQHLAAAEGQVGKGVAAASADASANLMELRQP